MVSGYQRAWSKLAVECSIFITLMLPVCPASLRSFGFGCASRSLCLTRWFYPGWASSCGVGVALGILGNVSYFILLGGEKKKSWKVTEGMPRTSYTSEGSAWFRLVPGTWQWSPHVEVSWASLWWLFSASSSFTCLVWDRSSEVISYCCYLYSFINLCVKSVVASENEHAWIWHRCYTCSILVLLTSSFWEMGAGGHGKERERELKGYAGSSGWESVCLSGSAFLHSWWCDSAVAFNSILLVRRLGLTLIINWLYIKCNDRCFIP